MEYEIDRNPPSLLRELVVIIFRVLEDIWMPKGW